MTDMIFVYYREVRDGETFRRLCTEKLPRVKVEVTSSARIFHVYVKENPDAIFVAGDKFRFPRGLRRKLDAREGEKPEELFSNMVAVFALQDEELNQMTYQRVLDEFDQQLGSQVALTDDEMRCKIEELIKYCHHFSESDAALVAEKLFNQVRGYGILETFLKDDSVTEIMVNGTRPIFVEREGKLQMTAQHFDSETELVNVINHIAIEGRRQIDEAHPLLDVVMKDKSRVNAILSVVTTNGPALTIRKFPSNPLTMEDLIRNESLDEETAEFLSCMVKAKYNIFISGGTGSGKTTLLNILSNCIGKAERVITIEDCAELQLQGVDNLVSTQARQATSEGKCGVSIGDLIKNALRMRPDRIIVGEVRKEETIDMLQAMNTGHDGSLSTGHANSPEDMMSRLETMVLSVETIPLRALRSQIASALDLVVHVSRMPDGTRKVTDICEVGGVNENAQIEMWPLYQYQMEGRTATNMVKGKLRRTIHPLRNTRKLELEGIAIPSNGRQTLIKTAV